MAPSPQHRQESPLGGAPLARARPVRRRESGADDPSRRSSGWRPSSTATPTTWPRSKASSGVSVYDLPVQRRICEPPMYDSQRGRHKSALAGADASTRWRSRYFDLLRALAPPLPHARPDGGRQRLPGRRRRRAAVELRGVGGERRRARRRGTLARARTSARRRGRTRGRRWRAAPSSRFCSRTCCAAAWRATSSRRASSTRGMTLVFLRAMRASRRIPRGGGGRGGGGGGGGGGARLSPLDPRRQAQARHAAGGGGGGGSSTSPTRSPVDPDANRTARAKAIDTTAE